MRPYEHTQIGYAVLAPLLAGLLGLLAGILAAGPHPVLLAVSAVLLAGERFRLGSDEPEALATAISDARRESS